MSPRLKDMSHRIRLDLLFRLRWNTLLPSDSIQILTPPYDGDTITVSSFLDHPSGNESLADPPLSRVQVGLADCIEKLDRDIFADPEDRYKPPTALTIHNSDGRLITLKQFVTEVHAYVHANSSEIKKCKAETYPREIENSDGSVSHGIFCGRPYLPSNIAFYFWKIYANGTGDADVRINVKLYAPGEVGGLLPMEKFWARQRDSADLFDRKRRDLPEVPRARPVFVVGPWGPGPCPPGWQPATMMTTSVVGTAGIEEKRDEHHEAKSKGIDNFVGSRMR